MTRRSILLLRSLVVLPGLALNAQTLSWKASDGNGNTIAQVELFTAESATGSPAAATTPKPIKVDSGSSTYVFVTPSAPVGPSGNWLRFAPVAQNADCTKAAYNTYPTAFNAYTPIYLCLQGSLASGANQGRGYYGASITFAPLSGSSFTLPIQLQVSPSGYLQLGSSPSAVGNVGDYNDYVFNVGVNNGVANSTLTVYAVVKDANGNVLTQPVTPQPLDDWVVVSSLASSNQSIEVFQIAVAPSQLPSGQTTPASRVRFSTQGAVQGESSVFVDASVTIPPPTLSAAVSYINFSYPGGPLSQTLYPQSSGAVISFTAAATADDGTGWLSVSPSNGDTTTPLVVSATIASNRTPGSYTGKLILTPTNLSANTVTVPVTLMVAGSSTYQLSGGITDPSGSCSSGVTVALSGGVTTNTVTASNGAYSFGALLSNQYVITPSKGGCTFSPPSISVNLTTNSLSNNFTGALAAVSLLFPLNGANGMPANSTLTWSAVSGATSYDVFFGTGNPPLAANVASTSWAIAGATPNVTYSWHVNAKNAAGTLASSPTWSFSTGVTVTASGLFFVPVPPCHLVDTRPNQGNTGAFGPPMLNGGETRTYYPAAGSCPGISPSAQAYSFNVTVRPTSILQYLTIWPSGQPVPNVSTLNAFQGGTVSNAAIVPAGAGGGVNVYVTDPTHLELDINGYFDSVSSGSATAFYTVAPCRVADTRTATGAFGGPSLLAGATRSFPVSSSPCLPAQINPAAYSLNVTVVPSGPLDFVELWAANSPQPPLVISLGSPAGAIVADAGIVQASGNGGAVSAYASSQTDLILDVNGYFQAPGSPSALLFHPVTPCRIADTRSPVGTFGGPIMPGNTQRTFPIAASSCGIPQGVQAYSLNVTVSPPGVLSFLTLLPTGQMRPSVSTLNDFTGIILANSAIVPAGTNDSIDVYVTHDTNVILDINGYFSFQ